LYDDSADTLLLDIVLKWIW